MGEGRKEPLGKRGDVVGIVREAGGDVVGGVGGEAYTFSPYPHNIHTISPHPQQPTSAHIRPRAVIHTVFHNFTEPAPTGPASQNLA